MSPPRNGGSRRRAGSWRRGAIRWATTSSAATPSPPRRWASTIRRSRWRGCSRRSPARAGSRPRSRWRSSGGPGSSRTGSIRRRRCGRPRSRRPRSTAPGRFAAEEIAGSLPDSATAILEYVAGAEGSSTTVFILTHAGIQAAVLPSIDTLTPAIRRFVGLLESGGRPDALAKSLGRAVLQPAIAKLPGTIKHLVIVPDGPLHRVPFDASGDRGRRPGRGAMG